VPAPTKSHGDNVSVEVQCRLAKQCRYLADLPSESTEMLLFEGEPTELWCRTSPIASVTWLRDGEVDKNWCRSPSASGFQCHLRGPVSKVNVSRKDEGLIMCCVENGLSSPLNTPVTSYGN
jgi:hypothetical protein